MQLASKCQGDTMHEISHSLRLVGLLLLTLAAIGRADSNASLAGSEPHFAGLGRLGRDLIRRENTDDVSGLTGSIGPQAATII
jgi:hypothetical protein